MSRSIFIKIRYLVKIRNETLTISYGKIYNVGKLYGFVDPSGTYIRLVSICVSFELSCKRD